MYDWLNVLFCNNIDIACIDDILQCISKAIPTETVKISPRDPYLTPFIKSLLIKHNILRRRYKFEEANYLAVV